MERIILAAIVGYLAVWCLWRGIGAVIKQSFEFYPILGIGNFSRTNEHFYKKTFPKGYPKIRGIGAIFLGSIFVSFGIFFLIVSYYTFRFM